jgi:hypothetical protein
VNHARMGLTQEGPLQKPILFIGLKQGTAF